MAEPEAPTNVPDAPAASGPARSKDEIALELMKFIAAATGYGRTSQASAGFSPKPSGKSAEEHVDVLLHLFERCRNAVNK